MGMKFSSFKYYTTDALKSLNRNKTIGTASAATVAATLFILGVFLLLMLNIQIGISSIEDKVEIKVFLKDDITFTAQRDLEVELNKMEGIKEIQYESKSDALSKFTESLTDKDKELLSGYDSNNNPMPSSFIVRLSDPKFASIVEEKAKVLSGVESVRNEKELVEKIIVISKTIRWIGLGIFIMLIGVSFFLIGNTIKLTVFSRRREIGIMKFVGATDWFIRWPFVIEGLIIGIIGALIADVLLYYAYRFTYTKITEGLIAAQLVNPNYIFSNISWQFILVGAAIGGIGSIFSLRKFLAV